MKYMHGLILPPANNILLYYSIILLGTLVLLYSCTLVLYYQVLLTSPPPLLHHSITPSLHHSISISPSLQSKAQPPPAFSPSLQYTLAHQQESAHSILYPTSSIILNNNSIPLAFRSCDDAGSTAITESEHSPLACYQCF